MPDEAADDDPASFILEGLKELPAYTQQPPMSLAELTALLESFERHKKRLVVPTARVAEFEAAVRAGGLGHAVAVLGRAWLEPDQAYLMQSEADMEADTHRILEAGRAEMLTAMREQAAVDMERWRAEMEEEARQEHERKMWLALHPWPRSPFTGLTGI